MRFLLAISYRFDDDDDADCDDDDDDDDYDDDDGDYDNCDDIADESFLPDSSEKKNMLDKGTYDLIFQVTNERGSCK